MKELSLQELKDIDLEILKVFHNFCVENNIKYFLSHGTLLGAIRYKGFIPWDDDVDVLIPREDYNRLISIFQDGERYKLFAFEKSEEYLFPFAKLCDMHTLKEEFRVKDTLKLGVGIDLFPLDKWEDDVKSAKKQAKCIFRNVQYLMMSKVNGATPCKNKLKYFARYMLWRACTLIGSEHFIKKIIKLSVKDKDSGGKYMGNKSWCVYGEREVIPSEVFSEAIEIEFEGERFFAPKGYDTYLTGLYGDYLPEPPKEKQVTHHDFSAYRLK